MNNMQINVCEPEEVVSDAQSNTNTGRPTMTLAFQKFGQGNIESSICRLIIQLHPPVGLPKTNHRLIP